MTTVIKNPKETQRKWVLVDAKQQALGRVATQVARLLMGKHRPDYSPSHDLGDYVVVINARDVELTGKKRWTKEYFSHSTYSGGGRILSFLQAQTKDPAFPVVPAVKGMLPKNIRGRQMIQKLHVYEGDQHPHAAQKPQPLAV